MGFLQGVHTLDDEIEHATNPRLSGYAVKTGSYSLERHLIGGKRLAPGCWVNGKTVYGASIYTERGSEGITMGVMDVLYSYGFKYDNPEKPYEMEGFVNSEGAVKGLEFYKSLYDCCTPPGASNSYMGEGIDAYKSGQVALQMNFAFTWPGFEVDPNVGGGKTGYQKLTAKAYQAIRPRSWSHTRRWWWRWGS